jgi:hypothetical protein
MNIEKKFLTYINQMTKINIGVTPGPNIREVEIDKSFKEITATDCYKIAEKTRKKPFRIHGWENITEDEKNQTD